MQQLIANKLKGFLELKNYRSSRIYDIENDAKYEKHMKIDFDMTEYNYWSRDVIKIFRTRVNIICGKKYPFVCRFLINLAILDKFIQDI